MKKLFLIGLKDLKLAFRDRAALTFTLLAPFLLTLGLGFVTGQFGGSENGIGNIPVVIVNQDEGELGQTLIEVLRSEDLSELVSVTVLDDPAAARRQVDDDLAAAAILIPAGFSQSVIPAEGQTAAGEPVALILYGNPTRPTSVGVVKAILEEFIARLEVGRVGGTVVVTQLLTAGLIQPAQAQAYALAMGQAAAFDEQPVIVLATNVASEAATDFNPLAYIAPGTALMFLMFTVSNGGRTLLTERNQGTLPRLLVSPTTSAQVLGGKIFGTYLTGVAQMLILILTSTLLFRLEWGDPLGVLVLVLAAVFGACGWGLVITALAKRPGQVSIVGSALMLIFGLLGGSFVDLSFMPPWVQAISKITPNAWGLDGFTTLALGGGIGLLLKPILALLAMGGVLFTVSLMLFSRRGMMTG
ncbi:MAG: ABC transporter permease [Anaerolineales bacterium]